MSAWARFRDWWMSPPSPPLHAPSMIHGEGPVPTKPPPPRSNGRTVSWDGRHVALDAPIRVPEPLAGDVYAYARVLLAVAELTDVKVVGRFNRVDLLVVPDDSVAGIVDAYNRGLRAGRLHTRHIGDDTDYFPGRDRT